ncbi:MAG: glycosyltransferase [Ruminococcus flavefaciens]|nr:glycosyltransferase [Ruminococcus flavefaciens]
MIYITYRINMISLPGVLKKIRAQCRVFKQVFGSAYYTLYNGHMLHLFDEDRLIEKEAAITNKECYEIIIAWMVKYKISKSYIRYQLSDRWFLYFLQKQKELGVKSVLEFPTVPYDNNSNWLLCEDIYCREHLHEYIKYCTTYCNFDEVFQIPCTVLVNGVDMDKQREKKIRKKDGTIVLLAVAEFSKWHGYERVMQGMHDYYAGGGEKNIILNFVGNDERREARYYRQLVREYQLHEHVCFCGELLGEELDEIYNNSDIAIGSLGFYKMKYENGSPIKLREYCARGIPFIYGYDDISFNENDYYAYKISNDETPVDIRKVIEFYNDMYDGRNFAHDMRQYASSHLTWDSILKPVIEYLS